MSSNKPRLCPLRRMAVIGSGAAGVSCAMALVQLGVDVTIFDGGESLENAQTELAREMSFRRPSDWKENELKRLRGATEANSRGIPRKLSFGSDYPFRDPHHVMRLEQKRTELLYSLAEGGLTTLWGANILPWKAADFAGWPIQLTDLETHYRAVLEFMPIAAKIDDLAEQFPLYRECTEGLVPSPQARELWRDLKLNRDKLRRKGMTFGAARLAVRAAQSSDPLSGCEYCGECLYGCVYGHIYSASFTLKQLVENWGVHHESGSVVSRLQELPSSVRLWCEVASGSGPREMEFDRVFVAAGVVPTARLILESRQLYAQPLLLKDSQYFIVPFLRWKKVREFRASKSFTLSQIFVEMTDPAISPYGVHLQFYSYTSLYDQVFAKAFPLMTRFAPALIEAILSRLFIVQGYLHSDGSAEMTLSLARGIDGKAGDLHLVSNSPTKARSVIHKILRKLVGEARAFGGVPVLPMLEIAPTGKSYHCGGSFPMSISPKTLETDRWGRLGGTGRTHLVDASVLPSIAATTITLTVMANAHRIATEVVRDLNA